MLDFDLTNKRINNFLGYGNLDSKIWFIGMEEGAGESSSEIETRINSYNNKPTMDLRSVPVKEHLYWFSGKLPNMQKTWKILIKILLSLDNKEITNEKIKTYQKNKLCSLNSNHCLLELMPLPAKSINHWPYNELSSVPYLNTREQYFSEVVPKRIKLFKDILDSHKPELVIFYSKSYSKYWKKIVDSKFIVKDQIEFCSESNTKYFIIPHPTAHGMKNTEWDKIINNIKRLY